ncbi:hypothetical protein BH10PSE7_BH10PSE7_05950 [soil metagenome]
MSEARRFPLSRQGTVAAGLLAIALAIAGLLAWAPYHWASVLKEELVPRQDLLAALERRSAGPSAKSRADRMKGLLDGPTVGLAAAELQHLVADIAAANEMNVESIQVLAPEAASSLTAVKIEILMSGSLKGASGSMYQIEMGVPLLFIEEADLKAQSDDPERLDVRLVVEGLFAPKRNEKVGL